MTLDGLILHAAGPLEGRRHNWYLYGRSGLDDVLQELFFVGGKQYSVSVYGDSGYNRRSYMGVPSQGSYLQTLKRLSTLQCRVRVSLVNGFSRK